MRGVIKPIAAGLAGLAVIAAAYSASLAQGPSRSVWDSVYTDAQAARGRSVYGARCASCHGDKLQGLDIAPALVGGRFTGTWNAQTAGDLAVRIRSTMPIDDPGSLSSANVADTIAFVFFANGFPKGAVELPPNIASLKQIRIAARQR